MQAHRQHLLRLVGLIDLTCLDEDARPARIEALCLRAQGRYGHTAAVCVYPEHVQAAREGLPRSIRVATVVNFPEGGEDPARVGREIQRARAVGADEIDAVLPWQALLAGREASVRAVLQAARAASEGALLKIILETAALAAPERIRQAAELALEAGADFLKTSTGKHPAGGADPQAAALLLDCLRQQAPSRGFKVAGGVRTSAEALAYVEQAEAALGPQALQPAQLRIGASGLLDAIEAELGGDQAEAADGY